MARKLTFAFALLVLTALFAGASFATVIPTQITFGPNTTGSVAISNTNANFTTITGVAWQAGRPQGSFDLGGANLSFASINNPYSFGPNSQTFSVTIGPDTISGWLSVQALFVGVYNNIHYGFFAGTFDITSSTPGFVATGYGPGVVDIDFVTQNGHLSSGELIAVPEPGTIAMVGSGLLAAAGMLRRKIKA